MVSLAGAVLHAAGHVVRSCPGCGCDFAADVGHDARPLRGRRRDYCSEDCRRLVDNARRRAARPTAHRRGPVQLDLLETA